MTGPRHRAMLAGEPVKPGQAIPDFRGEAWIFAYVTTGPVRFGKIVARDAEAQMQRAFFPHVFPGLSVAPVPPAIGRASWRERVCPYRESSVGPVPIKTK